MDKPYVFISYKSEEQQIADSLCRCLEERNIDYWISYKHIPPGGKYTSEILSAIRNCTCFVLLLSRASQVSEDVLSETSFARQQKKIIFPVQTSHFVLNDDYTYFTLTRQIAVIENFAVKSPQREKLLDSIERVAGSSAETDYTENKSTDDFSGGYEKETPDESYETDAFYENNCASEEYGNSESNSLTANIDNALSAIDDILKNF